MSACLSNRKCRHYLFLFNNVIIEKTMKMTILIIALVCLSCTAIAQSIRNSSIQPRHDSRERIIPMVLIITVISLILNLIASDLVSMVCVYLDLMPAAMALWLMTSSMWESEKSRSLLKGIILSEVVLLLYHFCRIMELLPEMSEQLVLFLMSLMIVIMTGLLIYDFITRLLDVKTVMKLGTVWVIVTLAVDVSYVLFVIISSAVVQLGLEASGVLLLVGLIVALGVRCMTDSEFVFWRKQERIIIESMKVTSVTSTVDGSRIEDVYKDLYERITALFEAEKPYLNNNLTINDIVRKLYSNKLYISRAISQFTGRNFCQFVNYYRVMHSIDIFRNNPELKIHELAVQSGFNSIVSYNMAFRLFMGENPSDWCRRERSNLIKKKK